MRKKILFSQSYVSPAPMSNDYEVYERLVRHFGKMKWVGIISPETRPLRLKNGEMFKVAIKTVLKSKREELIFCWNGDLSRWVWFFCRLLCRKRDILGQNFIFNPATAKQGLKRKLYACLYHHALHDRRYHVTVNSPELIPIYCKAFGVKADRFFTVYDHMTLNDCDKRIVEHKSLNNSGLYVVGG